MSEYYRHLPHFHPDNTPLFITWRLWGSMPAGVRLANHPTPAHQFLAEDRILDSGRIGPLWLKNPAIADLVANAILAGAAERRFYSLAAWVVMPNHVHILIDPKVEVPILMRWLKGSTARAANKILGRTGRQFWQAESFDRYVRRDRFGKTVRYIEGNPVAAGLAPSAEGWRWSSAGWQAETPAIPCIGDGCS